MERIAEKFLHSWYMDHNRKPLVLRGARQVGKSTLVRMYANAQGLALHEINLERHLYLRDVFRSCDMNRILGELQGLTGEIHNRKKALLFLDEIQAVPEALVALRYFREDLPDLAVIAAGSLLEFTSSDHNFSMPVGRVTYLHLGPLNFMEFLKAIDPELHEFLAGLTITDIIPESRHQKLLLRQREYTVIGGMPEAVQQWLETSAFSAVQQVQRGIVDTYIDDFAKYANQGHLARLQRVFRTAPAHLGRKVKFTNLLPEARSADARAVIDLLCKARILTGIHHTDCSGVPLLAGQDDSTFKLLYLDVGLVCLLLGLDWFQVQKLDERNLINEGPLAEQFVGQELLYRHGGSQIPELNYWLREGRSNNAEVDFVISKGLQILPIEVKAGKSGTLKSLHQFVLKTKVSTAFRFDQNRPSRQTLQAGGFEFKLISLPLYLAGRVLDFVED